MVDWSKCSGHQNLEFFNNTLNFIWLRTQLDHLCDGRLNKSDPLLIPDVLSCKIIKGETDNLVVEPVRRLKKLRTEFKTFGSTWLVSDRFNRQIDLSLVHILSTVAHDQVEPKLSNPGNTSDCRRSESW